MFFSVLSGFVLGAFLPAMSSRFGKFMPADPGTALAGLFHRPRFPRGGAIHRENLKKLWGRFLKASFLSGLLTALIYAGVAVCYPMPHRIWIEAMVFFVLLLAMVDHKIMLLPDILTIPLLLLGISYSFCMSEDVYFAKDALSLADSLQGAWFGYLLPTCIIFLMYPLMKGGFGGGDIKMLMALGAWFGFVGLNLALLLSCVIFLVMTLLRGERSGPYGPSLAAAALFVVFLFSPLGKEIFPVLSLIG